MTNELKPNLSASSVVAPPPSAILDSGATGTFVARQHIPCLRHTNAISNGPTVLSASGTPMHSQLKGTLPLSPLLSSTAQSAFVLDDLRTGTLVSLAQLCDDDCIAIFDKYEVKILKHNEIIITGARMHNGLWSIPIHEPPVRPPQTHQANGILRLDKPKQELATFHHASLGSPAPSTLLRAIRKGHLNTFPGLTTSLITKHLPQSMATTLGHQDQEAKNIRSTRRPPPDIDADLEPVLEPRSHQLCAMLFDHQSVLKSFSDQTGRFPVPSSRGNNYIFVLYHQDTNTIHTVAIPNRKAATIRNAWESTHKMLVHHGHAPELHILDNECSQDLKDAFFRHQIRFQRVPPDEHRVNAAERAIRTFKNHFVSILCTVDSKFPLAEWDRLLPQATLTLNLLRSSRIHPSLSAHASLFGNFDFNRTPLAPPGTRIVAHSSSDTRPPFGEHGKVGWYIGPSLEHYRCYKCYFTDTLAERDVLKVDFFPEKHPFPKLTRDDYLQQTAEDMLHLLQNPPSTTAAPHDPLEFGSPILNAYAKVADILRRAVPTAAAPPVSTNQLSPPIATDPLPRVLSPPVATPPISPPTLPTPEPPIATVPPPRVQPSVPDPSPRVQLSAPDPSPRVPPRKLVPPTPIPRKSPRARLLRFHFDPTTHRRNPATLLAQSMQHDPSVAGKMFDPVTGKPETIDSLLRGPDSQTWTRSLANEWGRCTQGITKQRPVLDEQIAGNNTMFFIRPNQVPAGRKVTYASIVCTMRPGKSEVYRVRITVGGNRLDAYQDVRSPAVGVTDTKLHLNSVISDAHRGARYCTGDIKDFFLGSEMEVYQYMRIHRKYLPDEIIQEYGLTPEFFDSNGYCYLEIRKGMYGLKEAAVLAYDQLRAHLAPFGYHPVRNTPGLWRHDHRPTTFTLAVDDFGIKFFTKTDADHLFDALSTKYTITKDWTGSSYLGFAIDWDYAAGHVDISMPGYVPKALLTLRHPAPTKPQHSPHRWTAPVYGQKVQLADSDLSPLLDQAGIKRVQQISGLFLYYSRSCDPTIIVALNEISNNQASPTEHTQAACNMLLDYLATHPDAKIRYHASDMVLAACSDAAYLVLPNARSRAAGHFFLTSLASATSSPPAPTPNGAIHVLCKTLRTVAASAAEAEIGSLFLNAQEAVPIRTALEEMGHPQPPLGTPLETDNSTAHGILHATVRLKRSKAFDMRYHWLQDRLRQGQFNLHWGPGKHNSADYFSKHHPPAHHKLMRSKYLHTLRAKLSVPQTFPTRHVTPSVRGCVSPSGRASGFPCPQTTSDAQITVRAH